MTKKITIISQDYDGCFAIMTADGLEGELNGVNKGAWEAYKKEGADVLKLIMASRQRYTDFLTNITKGSTEVRVYVGSDRQSYALDQLNISTHHNGSVFSAIEQLCQERNTPIQPWLFEPLLLSDPHVFGNKHFQRNRGLSYQNIKEETTPAYEVLDPPLYFKHPDGSLKNSKRPLLLNQMWDAYRQNPEATELEFNFIDDRQDLIQDILENLNPAEIPPKMTLVVSRFDYIGDILGEPQSFCHCGTIPTTFKQKHVRFKEDDAQKRNSHNSNSSVKKSFSSMIWNKLAHKNHTNTKECESEENLSYLNGL